MESQAELTIPDLGDLNATVTSGTVWQRTTQWAASCIRHYQTTHRLTHWRPSPFHCQHWTDWLTTLLSLPGQGWSEDWGGRIVLSCKSSDRWDRTGGVRMSECQTRLPGMRCWSLTFRPGDTSAHSGHQSQSTPGITSDLTPTEGGGRERGEMG